jgi:NAD(P)-dependent dehydrogenase (short-subunit alcohol dehydrogenase family)
MYPSQTPKTALLTGATGAIGEAIARQLATQGYRLVLVARDRRKAKTTTDRVVQASGNPHVRYELADLSRRVEIEALASGWKGPLHLLINNAAVTPPDRQETLEGIELQFATNVLGYFWMTQSFQPVLKASAPARIVDVASYWGGGLDVNDLEFKRRRYTNGAAYRQSKQANRMLVAAWADRLASDGVCINACHPGDVNSTLSNNLGFGGSQTPDQGADTPVWLGTTEAGGQSSGGYFENRRSVRCQFSQDRTAVETLYSACMKYG